MFVRGTAAHRPVRRLHPRHAALLSTNALAQGRMAEWQKKLPAADVREYAEPADTARTDGLDSLADTLRGALDRHGQDG